MPHLSLRSGVLFVEQEVKLSSFADSPIHCVLSCILVVQPSSVYYSPSAVKFCGNSTHRQSIDAVNCDRCLLLKITQPEKPKDSEKQADGSGYKIDEKKLAEIPIKARGLLDMDEEVAYSLLFYCLF